MAQHRCIPCVPGHEIVGRVTAVGAEVTKFKVGDLVGVGCLVDSCRTCADCQRGLEQYCENGADLHLQQHGQASSAACTFGGYSEQHRGDGEASCCASRPSSISAAAAPLLCAGITTYSPLRHWKVGPGQKVGIVGLGGLGHMGVKFAKRLRRPRRPVHHLAGQGGGRQRLGRRRGGGLHGCRGRWPKHAELRFHPRHGLRQPRRQCLSRPAEARRQPGAGRRARAPLAVAACRL